MPVIVLMFLAGGAVGLLSRPALDERRAKRKLDQAQSIGLAIAAALKEQQLAKA